MTTTENREAPILAEFAFRGAEEVNPPGFMQQGDRGQNDVGNYTVEDLAFKGYVKLWDNRTGRQILQPRWILWQTAQLKRPDGSTIFTDKDPHIPQNYGLDLVCLLHPTSPDFPMLSGMGFKPCLKHHAPTKAALDEHMKKTHKRAYAAMERHMTETRRDEDRALQMEAIKTNQQLMQAIANKMTASQFLDAIVPNSGLLNDTAVELAKARASVGISEAPLYESDKPKTVRRRGPNRKK